MKKARRWLSLFLVLGLMSSILASTADAAGPDQTTQYRVFQNDKLLKEFASRAQAIAYAKYFANSYVENVVTRAWVYSSFPTYQVIVDGQPLSHRYYTYEGALTEANKHKRAVVKDLTKAGIVWDNYPEYRLYQGDKTLPQWEFATLEEAKKAALYYRGVHIMKLLTNQWVWDDMTEAQKNTYRQQQPVYEVTAPTLDAPRSFAFLQDAIREAYKYDNSAVMNTQTGKQVYSNTKDIVVKQSGREIGRFYHLEMAVRYASNFAKATIERNGQELWYNDPSYTVLQSDRAVKSFHSVQEAVQYAIPLERAKVVERSGKVLWDNSSRLEVWGWTGTASDATMKKMAEQAIGLDVISPTWFVLDNKDGAFEDTSSKELVDWFHERGLEVHPLVQNQFDSSLTTAFLANAQGQDHFIQTLVARAAAIGADGLNIDFESVNAKDRAAFTDFVRKLTAKAHEKKLEVSIDLMRGSISWNHLTAFDHEQLAKIVDKVVIMAYDQHWSGSTEAGSVSGLQWTEQGIQEFLSYGMSRDQLILGMPFYIREWKVDASGKVLENRALYTSAVNKLLSENEYTAVWDPEFNQYKIQYVKDGSTYVFWLEDQRTIEARLELAKEYRLGGAAAWRLGQEPASFWDTIVTNK